MEWGESMKKEYVLGVKENGIGMRVVIFHLDRRSGEFKYIGIPSTKALEYTQELEEGSEVIGLNYCYDGLKGASVRELKEVCKKLDSEVVEISNKATKIVSGEDVKVGTALYSILVDRAELSEEDMYCADAKLGVGNGGMLQIEMNSLCNIKTGSEIQLLNQDNIVLSSKYGKFIEDTFQLQKVLKAHGELKVKETA